MCLDFGRLGKEVSLGVVKDIKSGLFTWKEFCSK